MLPESSSPGCATGLEMRIKPSITAMTIGQGVQVGAECPGQFVIEFAVRQPQRTGVVKQAH
ncbi:protein of unknown function (plasmid) [Cupriavidus taiwanensis]|uniref:Uncharacterized protein n=1 Tax=Cupriavidus taiwanensis TaxID=164546 RepID=A0A375ISL4_9BURK|nr:protein of unknown function [Cupriavidus taiwanensis]